MTHPNRTGIDKWLPIKDYPYEINTRGDIRNLRGRILKPKIGTRGYLQIVICNKGKQRHTHIHRLMAETFIPNPDNLPQVNHIDGNKLNNNLENLEWITHLENIRHAMHIGIFKPVMDREAVNLGIREYMKQKRTRTACYHGHPYVEGSFNTLASGQRVCLACHREAHRKWLSKL